MTNPPIDCDVAVLLIAASADRPLSSTEQTDLDAHTSRCAACASASDTLASDSSGGWISRLPAGESANADAAAGDLHDFSDLPVIDPEVYVWRDELRRGGMGRVVKARDRRLGREVAIKEILSEDLRDRFEREAMITARLQHPAIVPVYEAGSWPNGDAFYAMKMIAGTPLDRVIADTPELDDRLALLPRIIVATDAVAYAHSERIIHRDLKPANLIVGEFGEMVVIDWGLAKDLTDAGPRDRDSAAYRQIDDGLTRHGLGTPAYMPPEQARGDAPDERVDVYALGATLYHLLAGQPPYTGATAAELLDELATRRPRPLGAVEPGVPRELSAIVDKAMARDPKDRYASAGELVDELKRFQTGKLVQAHHYSTRERAARFVRRNRAAVMIAAIALVVFSLAGTASVTQIVDERDTARRAQALATERADALERSQQALLTEQGRRELLDGHPGRAALYLSAAYSGKSPPASLPHLLPFAAQSVDAVDWQIKPLPEEALDRQAERDPRPRIKDLVMSRDGRKVTVGYFPQGEAQAVIDVETGQVSQYQGETGDTVLHIDPTARYRVIHRDPGDRLLVVDSAGNTRVALPTTKGGGKLAFSQDGELLALTPAELYMPTTVWRTETGTVQRLIPFSPRGHRHEVLAFSPNREQLLFRGLRSITAWDLELGRQVHQVYFGPRALPLPGPGGFIIGVDPSRTWGVFRRETGATEVWNISAAELAFAIDSSISHPEAMKFSFDGRRLLTIGDELAVWDVGSGQRLDGRIPELGSGQPIRCASLSRDGKGLLAMYRNHTGRIWDVDTGELLAVLDGLVRVRECTFGADSDTIIAAFDDGAVRKWNIGRLVGDRVAAHSSRVRALAFTERGVISASDDGVVRFSSRTGELESQISTGDPVWHVDVDEGKNRLVVGKKHSVEVWDLSEPRPVWATVPFQFPVRSAALSPDRTRIAVVTGIPAVLRTYSADDGALLAKIPMSGTADSAVFTSDDIVAVALTGGTELWDVTTRTRAHSFDAGSGHITLLEDGRLVTAGKNAIAVLDPRTGESHRGELPGERVWQAAAPASGAVVYTVDATIGATKMWEPTGRLLHEISGKPEVAATAVALSEDGEWLAIGDADGGITIHKVAPEIRSPEQIAELVDRVVPWRLENGLPVLR